MSFLFNTVVLSKKKKFNTVALAQTMLSIIATDFYK